MSWITDNKQGVLGGLEVLGGIGMSFVNPTVGVPMIIGGVGNIAGEITQDKADEAQQQQLAQLEQQKQQQEVDNARQAAMSSQTLQSSGQQYYNPVFAIGGQMLQQDQNGQDLIEYQGNTHAQGGINLPNGAEVENNETSIDNYVFSDKLKPLGNKKNTFADLSKKIKNKYSLRTNDIYDEAQMRRELKSLALQQEALHVSSGLTPPTNPNQNKFEYGGGMIAASMLPNLASGLMANDLTKDVAYNQVAMQQSVSSQMNPYLINNNENIKNVGIAYNGLNRDLKNNASSLGSYLTNRIASGTSQAQNLSKISSQQTITNSGIINDARQFNAQQAQQVGIANANLATNINTTNTGIKNQEIQDRIGMKQNAIDLMGAGFNTGLKNYFDTVKMENELRIAGGENFGYEKIKGKFRKVFKKTVNGKNYHYYINDDGKSVVI